MEQSSRFGGRSAHVLWCSLHPRGIMSGIAMGAVASFLVLLSTWFQLPAAAGLLVPLLFLAAVSRVALNTAYSDGFGSLFEASGANLAEVGNAVLRAMLLNLVWLLPFVITQKAILAAPAALVGGPSPSFAVFAFALAGSLLPPLFFVVALAADSFSTLFDSSHWRRLLKDRMPDLVSLYALYMGGAAFIAFFTFGLAVGISGGKPKAMMFFTALAGCYSIGVAVLLLGRLVGTFLKTAGDGAAMNEDKRPSADPERKPIGKPELSSTRPIDVVADPKPIQRSSPVAVQKPVQRAVVQPRVGNADAEGGESLIEQLRAIQRITEASPWDAFTKLTALSAGTVEHPLITARKAIVAQQLERDDAHELAARAVELGHKLGNVGALAEIYTEFESRAAALGITPQDWPKIAAALQTQNKVDAAVGLYRRMLEADLSSVPAVKGIMRIAETRGKTDPDGALALYDMILELSPQHEFAQFVDRARETMQRRVVRS